MAKPTNTPYPIHPLKLGAHFQIEKKLQKQVTKFEEI